MWIDRCDEEKQGPPLFALGGPKKATKEMRTLDMRFAVRCQPSGWAGLFSLDIANMPDGPPAARLSEN